jgi:uncharacterized membrane protein
MSFTPKPRGNVIFSSNVTNQTDSNTETNSDSNQPWLSVSIYNTGSNNINLTINDVLIVIAANETFDDDFEDFDSVVIEPSTSDQAISYRLTLRG